MTDIAPPLRIAVLGGGIAGLATAVGILKAIKEGANVKLDVYEAAHKFAEIGAGVSFGPNAQRALRILGASEALDATAGAADDKPDCWFDFVVGAAGAQSQDMVAEVRGADAGRGNVHRADFLDGLIKLVPTELAHFNHRATTYTPHDSGITLHFANGSTAETDVIIASDGIKSSTRAAMFERKGLDLESQKAVYAEWVAWRGMVPRSAFVEAFGPKANDKMMHCGPQKHILHFPVRNGDFVNIVGFVQDPQHKKLGDRTGPWAEPRPKEEMLTDYSDFNEPCLKLLRSIEDPSIWGIFHSQPIDSPQDDRVILIGDAAHATTPHQGAGAGQACEDALFISAILTANATSSTSSSDRPEAVERALTVYTEARHARGQKVAKTSREAGLLYEFSGVDGEGSDTKKMGDNLVKRMDWIWTYDTEKELQKALNQLK